MKKFIKIEIECVSHEEGEILMTVLSEHNFYAFEQLENVLIAYIKEEDFDEAVFKTLLPCKTIYRYSIIEDKNWNEEWEGHFHPVTINNFLTIRASFHNPDKNAAHEIIITPKMSFGTGHHATTSLMIEMMQKINFRKKKILDFGTGTGILAILADKLGASLVLAIDNDEWSINNALENIAANNCNRIILQQRNTIGGIFGVDIVLANINFNILEENAEKFSLLLKKKSLLIISGLLLSDLNNIVSTFVKNGFIKRQLSEKEGWIALVFERQ